MDKRDLRILQIPLIHISIVTQNVSLSAILHDIILFLFSAGDRIVQWSKDAESAKLVQMPSIDNIPYRPPQLPMAVPRDLAGSLMSFHGYPFVWFVGQILKYLMQPKKEVEDFINERRKTLGFKHPIVG